MEGGAVVGLVVVSGEVMIGVDAVGDVWGGEGEAVTEGTGAEAGGVGEMDVPDGEGPVVAV
ncbi:MAG: hypothetical protein C4293_19945, partial [Nitrospiraceae bacterium]